MKVWIVANCEINCGHNTALDQSIVNIIFLHKHTAEKCVQQLGTNTSNFAKSLKEFKLLSLSSVRPYLVVK